MKRSALLFVFIAAACGHKGPGPASGPAPTGSAGVVAFETVRSVMQNPRCQNCHAAGDVPTQGDEGRVHLQNVQRGPTGYGRVGELCSTCHGAANPPDSYGHDIPPGVASGWHMPGPDDRFTFAGLSPHALCEQLKDPARNGNRDLAALRAQLDAPLMTWAWSPGAGRAPIPITRDAFLDAFATWAGAGAPCPP